MGKGIGISRVTREINAGVHCLQLHLDADLLERLLDDSLRLLPHWVHRRLIHDFHAAAILDAEAIATPFPPGLVKPLHRFLKAQFPLRVGRLEALGASDEITCGLTRGAIELLDDGAPIDGDVVRLPYEQIS